MSACNLGKLVKIELRDIWISESSHFTPWLAREENLLTLGETLGLELELEAQEKTVESFVQRAGPECDERLYTMFAIQHERRVALLGDTAIGRSARNVHLPEIG